MQQATALQKRAGELTTRMVEARADVRAAQIEYERAQARGVGHLLDTAKAAGVEGAQPLQALYRVAPEHDRLVRGALGTAADALVVHKWTDAEQVAAQAATQQVILVLESFHDGQGAEPSSDVRPDVLLGQEVSRRNGCSARPRRTPTTRSSTSTGTRRCPRASRSCRSSASRCTAHRCGTS